ncbi:hypothetical protein GQ457_04G022990 [Hibiscus cannabinus]
MFLFILLVCNHKVRLSGLALLSFKQLLQGQTESYLINWSSSDPNPCSWHGFFCRNQKVHALVISNMGLSGYLSPGFVNLSSIFHVNLENNSFHGILPTELFAATSLKSLVLSSNLLYLLSQYGPLPTEVDNLKNLQTLDISWYPFNGTVTVPSSLVQCKN